MNLSRTQIDRLGNRLRLGPPADADLRLLDQYRRSFGDAYAEVVAVIRTELHMDPTGRPAKSTSSIVEKLKRESIRLVQVQDIAGCRIVVTDRAEQDRIVDTLRARFAGTAAVVDRRANPSHGYRAVHVVVSVASKPVEVQVRTSLQHAWAELSEKLSDVFDPAIKYGGGPPDAHELLASISEMIVRTEDLDERFSIINAALDQALKSPVGGSVDREWLDEMKLYISKERPALKSEFDEAIRTLMANLERLRGS
jgi:GTP pyrophosphokinase